MLLGEGPITDGKAFIKDGTDASFMADWQFLAAPGKARHKQFGDAQVDRPVPVKLPPVLPKPISR